jgi:large subunit ribosomal protein L18
MTTASSQRHAGRLRRHRRVRKKISGTAERPRLAVYRSNKHISLFSSSTILNGHTIAAASTVEPDLRKLGSGSTVDAAKRIGTFDRSARQVRRCHKSCLRPRWIPLYHGRVAAAADAAREAGLEF